MMVGASGTYLNVLTAPDVGAFDRFEDCALVLNDAGDCVC